MDPDAVLLDRWRAGETAAGEALFERYFDAVVRFFRNKVVEGTDDLVQHTFLACVEGRDRLREDASFRSYLFGVAHNLLRRHFQRLDAQVDFTVRSVFDLGPSPTGVVAESEHGRLVLEALRRIPFDYQVVLELHYWEELTAAEIGEATGVPLGTAKTRLRRGRELLLEQLTALMDGDATGIDLDHRARNLRVQLLSA